MDRKVFLMKVREGKYAAYKHAHDHLWPEIQKQLVDYHIDVAIYYYEPYVFVIQQAPNSETWQKHGSTAAVQRWNLEMAECLETQPNGSIQMYDVEEVFAFGFFSEHSDSYPTKK